MRYTAVQHLFVCLFVYVSEGYKCDKSVEERIKASGRGLTAVAKGQFVVDFTRRTYIWAEARRSGGPQIDLDDLGICKEKKGLRRSRNIVYPRVGDR